MTFFVESALIRAGLLLAAARNALATATTDDAVQTAIASAVLDTAADHTRQLAQATITPGERHIEGDADQRVYNTARLAEHAKDRLCEISFGDRPLGEQSSRFSWPQRRSSMRLALRSRTGARRKPLARPPESVALLLEREAAERLRISQRQLKKLRLAGHISYLPGRPVRIDERDLEAYVEDLRAKAAVKLKLQPASSRDSVATAEAAARARGIKRMLQRRGIG